MTYRRLRQSAREYHRFPMYVAPSALLSTVGYHLPGLLLASLFGVEQTGYYGLAYRVVSLPMALVGGAVAQVFLGEASTLLRERPERLLGFFTVVTSRMLYVGLAILALGAVCPFTFGFVFGAKWQAAGIFAVFLSIRGAAQVVVAPISSTAVIGQRQGLMCVIDALRCVVAILSLYVPFLLGYSALVAVAAYCITGVLHYVLCYYVCLSVCRTAAPSKPESPEPSRFPEAAGWAESLLNAAGGCENVQ
jgi:O-antigen/teichoic acid export membrane protein